MRSDPLVSVIIPHYDRAALLGEAVGSVLKSTEQPLEIIVVDDGSSESQRRRIDELRNERVKVLDREGGPKGPSRCRNIGLAASRGEYIVFLDSDDLMAPWCLENRLAAAQHNADADFWVFPVMLFDKRPGDSDVLWNEMNDGRGDALRFASSDPPWHTSSPLWRRASLDRIGAFNENVFYGDDADLHLRALVTGLRARQYPDALPDVFVRRSDVARVTSGLSPSMIESRRTRLHEATRFLRDNDHNGTLLRAFEGQYFVEAEFLLFNHADAGAAISAVLDDWRSAFAPNRAKRWVVTRYFDFSLATRDRLYPALRVARRVVMRLLPHEFFPRGGWYNTAPAPEPTLARIRKAMRYQQAETR